MTCVCRGLFNIECLLLITCVFFVFLFSLLFSPAYADFVKFYQLLRVCQLVSIVTVVCSLCGLLDLVDSRRVSDWVLVTRGSAGRGLWCWEYNSNRRLYVSLYSSPNSAETQDKPQQFRVLCLPVLRCNQHRRQDLQRTLTRVASSEFFVLVMSICILCRCPLVQRTFIPCLTLCVWHLISTEDSTSVWPFSSSDKPPDRRGLCLGYVRGCPPNSFLPLVLNAQSIAKDHIRAVLLWRF